MLRDTTSTNRHAHLAKIEILRKQVANFGSRQRARWQIESDRAKNGNLANNCHGRKNTTVNEKKKRGAPLDPIRLFAGLHAFTSAGVKTKLITRALSRGGVATIPASEKSSSAWCIVGEHVDKGRAWTGWSLRPLASSFFVLQQCLIEECFATHAAPLCLLVFESGL